MLEATERMLLDRRYEYTPFGAQFYADAGRKDWLEFSVATYNVLAQNLLQDNVYLYSHCADRFLAWDYRSANLLREISFLQPDVRTAARRILQIKLFGQSRSWRNGFSSGLNIKRVKHVGSIWGPR